MKQPISAIRDGAKTGHQYHVTNHCRTQIYIADNLQVWGSWRSVQSLCVRASTNLHPYLHIQCFGPISATTTTKHNANAWGGKKQFLQPLYQATSTFHAPRVTSETFRMHSDNTKFNAQNAEWISICIISSVYFSTHHFIHLLVCLTPGPKPLPKPLPKPALHIVRSRASSFKWKYPLLSLTFWSRDFTFKF